MRNMDPKKIEVSHPKPIQNDQAITVARIREPQEAYISQKRVSSGEVVKTEAQESIMQVFQ